MTRATDYSDPHRENNDNYEPEKPIQAGEEMGIERSQAIGVSVRPVEVVSSTAAATPGLYRFTSPFSASTN